MSALEDDNTYKKYITDKLGTGNIEYTRKSGEYSKDTLVYQLKDGNNPVGVRQKIIQLLFQKEQ